VRPVVQYYSGFDNPLATFQQKQQTILVLTWTFLQVFSNVSNGYYSIQGTGKLQTDIKPNFGPVVDQKLVGNYVRLQATLIMWLILRIACETSIVGHFSAP